MTLPEARTIFADIPHHRDAEIDKAAHVLALSKDHIDAQRGKRWLEMRQREMA